MSLIRRGGGGGIRLEDELRECGGRVNDRRRSRRGPTSRSLEQDALSFLHPRVVLHQLWVQERILRDHVLYPLHQAVGGESRVEKGTSFSGESLDKSFRSPSQRDHQYAFIWHLFGIFAG